MCAAATGRSCREAEAGTPRQAGWQPTALPLPPNFLLRSSAATFPLAAVHADADPHVQCLTLHLWLLTCVGVLLPLACLARMEASQRRQYNLQRGERGGGPAGPPPPRPPEAGMLGRACQAYLLSSLVWGAATVALQLWHLAARHSGGGGS